MVILQMIKKNFFTVKLLILENLLYQKSISIFFLYSTSNVINQVEKT